MPAHDLKFSAICSAMRAQASLFYICARLKILTASAAPRSEFYPPLSRSEIDFIPPSSLCCRDQICCAVILSSRRRVKFNRAAARRAAEIRISLRRRDQNFTLPPRANFISSRPIVASRSNYSAAAHPVRYRSEQAGPPKIALFVSQTRQSSRHSGWKVQCPILNLCSSSSLSVAIRL